MTTAKCDAAKRDAAKRAPTNPATRLGAHIIMAAKQLCDECDMAKWVHAGPATAMGAHIITAAKNDAAKQRRGEMRRDEVGPNDQTSHRMAFAPRIGAPRRCDALAFS